MSKVLIQRDGAALIEDEDDGEIIWCDEVDKEVPRESWADDFGPTGSGPTDDALATFLMHQQVFGMEAEGDPQGAEAKLQAFGYQDAGHFYRVVGTMMKHFGTPHGPNVEDASFQDQRFINASMKASQMAHQATMQQTVGDNPDLMSPVEGVTMEQYAGMQAQVMNLGEDQLPGFLAQHGMDAAKWSRVSNEWNDRMSKDTTASLSTIYAQAFQGAGAGQFGAQAQAQAATGYDGSAAAGGEPMPFEKCCEIQGAMQAWSATGQDVNALLSQTFGMNAADFSNAHTWWLTQLAADVARFGEYTALVEKYQQQYSAGAPDAPDSDLSF